MQLSTNTWRRTVTHTPKLKIRKELVGLRGFRDDWWPLRYCGELWVYRGSEHESSHGITRQTVICVEPDHRKRSRTYDEETKQKTRLLRSNKAATEAPFIGCWNWKHLLLFWGKSTAISCFGYAWVIFNFSLYFSIVSVRISLPIWNTGNWKLVKLQRTTITRKRQW